MNSSELGISIQSSSWERLWDAVAGGHPLGTGALLQRESLITGRL